eukprot:3930564-Prymnesium_polylepis.1
MPLRPALGCQYRHIRDLTEQGAGQIIAACAPRKALYRSQACRAGQQGRQWTALAVAPVGSEWSAIELSSRERTEPESATLPCPKSGEKPWREVAMPLTSRTAAPTAASCHPAACCRP